MKYNININQLMGAEIAPNLDLIDWAIFDYIKAFFLWRNGKTKKIRVDDKDFVWINYRYLLKEMPLLRLKQKASLSIRLDKLEKNELIEKKTLEGNVYVSVGRKAVYLDFEDVNGLKGLMCPWCLEKDVPLLKHHYPVSKADGGSETVEICPNCHYKFHFRGIIPEKVLAQTNEALAQTNAPVSVDKRNNNINNNNTINNIAEQSSADIAEIIDMFKIINPSYKKLFGNTTQRGAVERLLKQFGKEELAKRVQVLVQTNLNRYAPKITTPLKLEDKMGDLIIFMKQYKNNVIKQL